MNTHAALDALVCGYASRVRFQKVLVMMGEVDSTHLAYVDESGGPGAGRILLLSACVHRYPVWASFSDEWDRVLRDAPTVSAFHVREARSRSGEFVGWSQRDLDYKIIALTEVIMQFQPHVITCWVSEKEYAKTVRESGPPDLHHAYFLCFMGTVIKVADYQRHMGVDTPVDYVFDEKGDIGHESAMWYPAMKDSLPQETKNRMGSTPVFRDDDKVLPLQAADLIAWNRRREKEFPGFDPERVASMRLDELSGAEIHFGEPELELLASRVQTVPGIENVRGGTSHYKQLKRAYRKGIRRQASGYKPEEH